MPRSIALNTMLLRLEKIELIYAELSDFVAVFQIKTAKNGQLESDDPTECIKGVFRVYTEKARRNSPWAVLNHYIDNLSHL